MTSVAPEPVGYGDVCRHPGGAGAIHNQAALDQEVVLACLHPGETSRGADLIPDGASDC